MDIGWEENWDPLKESLQEAMYSKGWETRKQKDWEKIKAAISKVFDPNPMGIFQLVLKGRPDIWCYLPIYL